MPEKIKEKLAECAMKAMDDFLGEKPVDKEAIYLDPSMECQALRQGFSAGVP